MANLLKVSKGQRFRPRADEWNAFVDAARYVKDRAINQEGDANGADPTTIVVRNASSFAVPQFGLLWIVGAPWRGLVTVDRPAHPFLSALLIAAEPIAANGIGHAWRDGMHPLRIWDWDILKVADFPLLAISQADSFDVRAWTGTGTVPIVGKLDDSPLVLADLTGRGL